MNEFTRSVIESRNVITFGSFLQVTVTNKAVATLQAPLMQYLLAQYILEATFSVSPKLVMTPPLLHCIIITDLFSPSGQIEKYQTAASYFMLGSCQQGKQNSSLRYSPVEK